MRQGSARRVVAVPGDVVATPPPEDRQWAYVWECARVAAAPPRHSYDLLFVVGASGTWEELEDRVQDYARGAPADGRPPLHPAFTDALQDGWRIELARVEQGRRGLEDALACWYSEQHPGPRVRVVGGIGAALSAKEAATKREFARLLTAARLGACVKCSGHGHFAWQCGQVAALELETQRRQAAEARAGVAEQAQADAEAAQRQAEARATNAEQQRREAQQALDTLRALNLPALGEHLGRAIAGFESLHAAPAPNWKDAVVGAMEELNVKSGFSIPSGEPRFRIQHAGEQVKFAFTRTQEPHHARCPTGRGCRAACGYQTCAFAEAKLCFAELLAAVKQKNARKGCGLLDEWRAVYNLKPRDRPARPRSRSRSPR